MSLNANLAPPTLSPQQQDTGLPDALTPSTPDVANPYEPEQSGPVLLNRAAINSSVEIADEVNQPPISIAEHSAPEKSNRSSSASSADTTASAGDELTALIKAAEQVTGELPVMLNRAAQMQEQDLERRALTIASLLEPVLILTMGVVVLMIVLAVLMPIIEINQLVK